MGNLFKTNKAGGAAPSGNVPITIDNVGTTSDIDVAGYATASVTTQGLYKPTTVKDNTGSSYSTNGTKTITGLENYTGVKINIAVPSSSPTFGTAVTSTSGTVSLDSSKTYAVSIALYHTSQTTPSSDGNIFYQEYSYTNNLRCYMLGVKNATYLSISGNYKVIIATPLN